MKKLKLGNVEEIIKGMDLSLRHMEFIIFHLDDANVKTESNKDAFRAALKLFMYKFMPEIYEFQENIGMTLEEKISMVKKCGEEISALVKKYANIDTKEIYKDYEFPDMDTIVDLPKEQKN